MEESRKGWLEDSVGGDLLLGVRWLHARIQSRTDGIIQEPDKAWAPLYQDDGSCLTINPVPTGQDHLVRIIETSPLTISDGHTSIRATLAPACLAQLSASHDDLPATGVPLGSTLSLCNYAVRCTSFGPPADRLHLVLHAVEWHRGRHVEAFEMPDPIDPSTFLAPFKRLLAELTDARLQEHSKYVYQDPDLSIMADSPPDDSQMSQSFATQMPAISGGSRATDPEAPRAHLITHSGGRQDDRETRPQGLPGRADPALLALFHKHALQSCGEKVQNQAEAPIQPQARPSDEIELSRSRGSCLFIGNLPPATTVDDLERLFRDYSVVCTDIATDPHSFRLSSHAFVALSTPSEAERAMAELNGQRVLDREVCIQLSHTSERHSDGDGRPEATIIQASSKTEFPESPEFAEFPDWLSGSLFAATTLVITEEQKDCLLRREAWDKPPPGVHGPLITIPIGDKKQVQDYFNSLQRPTETHPNSSNDPSTAAVRDDPIYDQPHIRMDDDNQMQSPLSQVSLEDSVLTWSSSPSPSPKQANLPSATLPPDSTLGSTANETPKMDVQRNPPLSSPFGSTSGTTPRKDEPLRTPSSSTGPSQSNKSPFGPVFGSASKSRKNASKHNAAPPGSSSLGRPLRYDLDEDEEMEMSVPFALGEDLSEGSGTLPVVPSNRTVQSKSYHRSRPVAPVQETPRRPVSSSSRAEPPASSLLTPSGMESRRPSGPVRTAPNPSPRYPSSTSSTTTWPNGKPRLMEDKPVGALDTMHPRPGGGASSMSPRIGQSATDPILLSDSDEEMEDVQVQVEQSSSAPPLPPDPTLVKGTMSAGQNLRDNSHRTSGVQDTAQTEPAGIVPTDSSVKRKTETSPSRLNARRPKRRGVSMRSFGSSPSRDHSTAEEAHRQSGQMAQVPATHVAPANTTAKASPKATSSSTPKVAAKVAPSTHAAQVTSKAQLHDGSNRASLETSRDNDALSSPPPQSHDPSDSTSTVFARFKEAYPDYPGSQVHFIELCKKLYREKTLPIFLWDDYVIRHRTDYTEHVKNLLDEGKDRESYREFFNSIKAAGYTKNILSCAEVVRQALVELGVDLDHAFTSSRGSSSRSMSTPRAGFGPRSSFRSSPRWDGATDEPPIDRIEHGERGVSQRSSLSMAEPRTMSTPRAASAPRSSSGSPLQWDRTPRKANKPPANRIKHREQELARQSSLSRAGHTIHSSVGLGNGRSERESARNAFRHFAVGQQKMTSTTGSLQEDITEEWPATVALRPALPRRPDVDVLSWKDDL